MRALIEPGASKHRMSCNIYSECYALVSGFDVLPVPGTLLSN
jgi:hypothetical protein